MYNHMSMSVRNSAVKDFTTSSDDLGQCTLVNHF